MWGIRAIRVGVLLCGWLALIAAVGCQSWKGTAAPPTAPAKGDDKDPEKVISEWKRGGGWFQDQPTKLTAERVHGGIY